MAANSSGKYTHFSGVDATLLKIGGVAVTSSAAELNALDGLTSSVAELNILTGVTSSAAELNIVDGVTATATELNHSAGVTLGTAIASKAVTTDASINVAGLNSVGLAVIDADSGVHSLTSHAVTTTKYFAVITTEALTTAAAASQAFVITKAGVAAGDLAFVQACGGTNSATQDITFTAVTTTNTITVTVYNNTVATSLNGTLKFNLMVVKA